ncbi:MAG: hypothetical protein CMM74_12435 [Rhodospirillaceae bacterium]|nr:hypothetical protein [Rhodospirillaceae bacterium]
MVDISTEAETKNGESPSGDVPSPLTDQADPGGITGDPAGDVAGQIDSKNGNLEESAAATGSPPPDAPADASPEDAAGEPDLKENGADATNEETDKGSEKPADDLPDAEPETELEKEEEKEEEEEEDENLPDTSKPQIIPERQTDAAPDSAPPSTLNSRYDIHSSKPLPDLDCPSARAFEVEDRMEPLHKLFALICIPSMPVRWKEIENIAEQDLPFNLPLVGYGNVDWPLLGQKCLAIIFERPMGGRVMDYLNTPGLAEFKKIDTVRQVVNAGMNGIRKLASRDITHRSIRPDNLFFLDEEREEVVLGSFVTSPPGFDQPLVFETISRSMAYEGGRGSGDTSDDLYAFGATLAFLIQKQNPVKKTPPEQLILSKISKSTYQTLIGKNLLTSSLLEPLRGLMQDDPELRWGFEELELWSSKKQVPPTESRPPNRSQRPFKFSDFDHITSRSLAYSMSLRPESAMGIIKDGTLIKWVSRSLEDKELAAAIAATMEIAKIKKEGNSANDDLLLTKVLLLMDPLGPINYKSIALMPDSFGGSLGVELLRGGGIKTLAEAIFYEVPQIWFDLQTGSSSPQYMEMEVFRQLRVHLQKAGPGFGVERCLYETNPGYPCQSPLVKAENIIDIAELLPVLNAADKNADTKTNPVDRHIAAFIAARYHGNLDRHLGEIADPDNTLKILGSLRILAHLQDRLGFGPQHGLSKWLGSLMGPVIKIYKSRKTRKAIETEISRIVRTGDLNELLSLMDDPEMKLRDEAGFASAIEEFGTAEEEIVKIGLDTGPHSTAAEKISKQAAAITSILVMIFIISVMTMSG